ncbi:D-glycerate 3-kinase, chloroplastic isoform X2 [Abrus precatorius]|uniref:D-glycerate 3-kinase, chloroplastic isoform X2 n=1 Tax=Abrus precatorius TaxID=3816 RepID=A0A8B8K852_ABRPR|nr:D-glycerate 3-kinase, chloroplastic isoform X2 [Abrus precatorius]
MATLNVFSQPWQSSSSFCSSNTNNNISFAFHNHNHISNNSKLNFFSNSRHFSLLSSQSKLSHFPTHFSKSGRGSSWLQNGFTGGGIEYRKRPLYSVFPTKPAQVSSVQDLFEFICSGPLLDKIGLTQEEVAESIDKWLLYGHYLCRLFQLNELYLTEPQKARLYHYYVPVFLWCEHQIAQHQSKFKDGEEIPPLVIGFSAPQGCGKTTLVFALDYLFQKTSRKSATISIDDFYLTAEGQNKLREDNPENALLELRGNAGSHDLAFSVETMTSLTKMTREGMKMKLPRYDKSAFNGRGDRADPSTWPEVEGPLTVVLFEGWMLGFKPVPVEAVKVVDPQLETVNKNLEAYYDAWDKYIKSWIVIKIKDPSCVYQWRLQAEIAMREAGKPGMSDDEVRDFVSRYLPAYKAYLPTLYSQGPNGSDPEHLLTIEIDEGRNPILAV